MVSESCWGQGRSFWWEDSGRCLTEDEIMMSEVWMVFKYVGDAEDTLYLLRRTLDK